MIAALANIADVFLHLALRGDAGQLVGDEAVTATLRKLGLMVAGEAARQP